MLGVEVDGFALLTDEECWALLAKECVGRVGLSVGALPAILPVNYVTDGDRITFLTGSGSKLRAARQHEVIAFEVDHLDYERHTGWSVLAIGIVEEVLPESGTRLPQPWGSAAGRDHLASFHPEVLTGRRLEAP
jgi:nitroimidazol reductase NimA-like FMN-containing flavoprotein (pyridoxamine 5'-phosphate oxidase superfamily)